ncbi:MAG: glycerophosphodiester phosphodiesterase [Acidimicrobiia bacterium]
MTGFLIYGHRGASAHVRANTVEAYALAIELGADGVELDVRPSRDGVLVIHHDDRPAPGAPPFVELDFDEIRATTPWVPTLDEAWEAIGPAALLNIEIKNDEREADYDSTHQVAAAVAHWLAGHEIGDRVLVSSFNRDSLAVVKDLAPRVPTGQLAGAALDPSVVIDQARSDGHISVNLSLARTLQDAKGIVEAAGELAVLVWTVNDPDDAIALFEAGVSGIFTDDPGLMVDTFSGRP